MRYGHGEIVDNHRASLGFRKILPREEVPMPLAADYRAFSFRVSLVGKENTPGAFSKRGLRGILLGWGVSELRIFYLGVVN